MAHGSSRGELRGAVLHSAYLLCAFGLALAACGCTRHTEPQHPLEADAGTIVDAGAELVVHQVVGRPTMASDASAAPSTLTYTFANSSDTVMNPERGFYRVRDLPAVTDPNGVPKPTDFSDFRARGETLVLGYVRLDDFRTTPISDAFLTEIRQRFDSIRAAGLKLVLRFAYNRGPYPVSEPDASKAQILQHITQLTPLLADDEDIIAVLQAGFIGAWGEWHSSTNGLLDNPQDRLDIANALLAALPASRAIQVRVPTDKSAMYGGPATAFDGSATARSGHHNDCFLASADDYGTYPTGARETWLTFLAADTLFVPMGGETCGLYPTLTDCTPAMGEMSRIHYSYLNGEFDPDVIAAWSQQGCLSEIGDHLGYRFIADQLELPSRIQAGKTFQLRLQLHNEGFAAPFNVRPVSIVFDGPQRLEFPIASDLRTWRGSVELTTEVTLPAGSYSVALWLPDASARLRDRSEYAIRLPNAHWDDSTGLNVLLTKVVAGP